MTQTPKLVKEIAAESVETITRIPDSIKDQALELGFNIEIDSSKCVIGQDAEGNTIFEEAMVITREIPDDLTIKDFEGAVMQFIQMNTGSKVNLPFENSLIKVRSKSSVWNMDGFLIESKASGKLFRVKTRIPGAEPIYGNAHDQDQSFINYTLQIALASKDLGGIFEEMNVALPEVYAAGRNFMIVEVPNGGGMYDEEEAHRIGFKLNNVLAKYILTKRQNPQGDLWENIFPQVIVYTPIPFLMMSNLAKMPDDGRVYLVEPFFYLSNGIRSDHEAYQSLLQESALKAE